MMQSKKGETKPEAQPFAVSRSELGLPVWAWLASPVDSRTQSESRAPGSWWLDIFSCKGRQTLATAALSPKCTDFGCGLFEAGNGIFQVPIRTDMGTSLRAVYIYDDGDDDSAVMHVYMYRYSARTVGASDVAAYSISMSI
jgi:hypothetical protein